MELEEAIGKFRRYLEEVTRFDPEAFALAIDYFGLRTLRKGEFFVESGKTCRHFGFIVTGLMRAYDLEEGDENVSCFCSENAFATSTISFITQTPSNTSIQALNDVSVLTISYAHLNELYAKSPFWQQVGRIIAEKELIYEQFGAWRNSHLSAKDKYLTLLRENPGIVNRVPLHMIASYLHIKPETLSRIRKKITFGKS